MGSGDRSPPEGSRGKAPLWSLGYEVAQKPKWEISVQFLVFQEKILDLISKSRTWTVFS